jgi:4-amino-4-deoxy-L-arabinose transferase-like glycosyltransferase
MTTKEKLLLAGILLVALGFRLWGIQFGLPSLYHPDEVNKVEIAQTMFKTGDLDPDYFLKPTLFIYLNAAAYIPYYIAGKLSGVFQVPADIPQPVVLGLGIGWTSMPTTFLLGRGLTVLFGTGAVFLLFLAGRQLTGSTAVGLLAALMMTVSSTNVTHSRYITENTYLVFFILLTFWASALIFQKGKAHHYVLAGAAAGLTISSKYTGGLVLLLPVLAHFLRFGWPGFRQRNLYLALFFCPLAFLATTPFAVLNFHKFWSDMTYEAGHYSTGHAGMEGNVLRWYLVYLWYIEGPIILVALLELARGVYHRAKPTLLLAAFPAIYFVFINSFVVRNDRTILPMIPLVLLLAAIFIVRTGGWLQQLQPKRWAQSGLLLLAALTVGFLAWPAAHAVRSTRAMLMVDSRETARVWIEQNLPPGSKIAYEAYAPYMEPAHFSLHYVNNVPDHPLAWYAAEDFDYLVFSRGAYARYYREPDRYPAQVAAYDYFFAQLTEVKIFTDGGTEVRIYRAPPAANGE